MLPCFFFLDKPSLQILTVWVISQGGIETGVHHVLNCQNVSPQMKEYFIHIYDTHACCTTAGRTTNPHPISLLRCSFLPCSERSVTFPQLVDLMKPETCRKYKFILLLLYTPLFPSQISQSCKWNMKINYMYIHFWYLAWLTL